MVLAVITALTQLNLKLKIMDSSAYLLTSSLILSLLSVFSL